MLQAIRIPISIFHAPIPTTAASQIHSDEPQTCAIPKVELLRPRVMKMVLTPDSCYAKTYRETGANQRDTKQRNRMGR